MTFSPLLVTVFSTLGLCLVVQKWRRTNAGPPLPPGPNPLPVVGNIMDLPPKGTLEYLHWQRHREQYGPISSVTIFGQTLVLLSDREVLADLLDQRGAKNSSRPWLEFAFGMCGIGDLTIALPYGDRLRLHRKLMLRHIGTIAAVERIRGYQEQEVGLTLERMLDAPEKLFHHMQTQSASLILKLTYGYSVDPTKEDPFLFLVHRMMSHIGECLNMGGHLVDLVPALKYLPSWVPGSGFVNKANRFRTNIAEAAEKPFEFVKRQMETNTQKPSFVSNTLSDESDNDYEKELKFAAVTLFGGGYDTTLSVQCFLWLALIQNPEVLRKVQAEIDHVVGPDRLPQFTDRDQLPYVNAVVKEAYRWQPVVSIGLVHSTDEDQVYRGYFIPKGSAMMTNIRWLTHDPTMYHSPDEFKPERFLAPYNEPDPKDYVFGFGRRICPGRLLADSILFLSVAQTLAVFNFSNAKDAAGNPIEAVLDIPPGAISIPKDYQYHMAPRSPHHAQLIRDNAARMKTNEGGDARLLDGYGLMPEM